ncbi:P-loop containing nucleoside triphosphate hydrolase protein [Thelephora terrestris]|uniref:RNA helicase n=1 Tax=Thelephora terrestris TaxID=56493 RepID=A0A9P6H3I3_9AGAM|nr:P-loop containing nucleoside triphosphate hydrolase protein [Thelephora terrestris]
MASLPPLKRKKQEAGCETSKKRPPSHVGHTARSSYRDELPIAQGKPEIIRELQRNSVTILVGETGSGKSTQIPQYILEAGISRGKCIAITQPRRVGATSLAARVATERGVPLGTSVGYSIRFDENYCPSTKIKFITDGMLVRELISDALLSHYGVIIIDEAHERTLRTDVLLASLKRILQRRNGLPLGHDQPTNPLKVVIMSATLDARRFSDFFGGAELIYVKGRQYAVRIFHTPAGQPDFVEAALRTFFQIHTSNSAGDVLIFLPGQEEIENLLSSINFYARQLPQGVMPVLVYPMYSSLHPSQQSKVFEPTPYGSRKCILATNIAETSITIPGIKYVIDTGKCKEKRYVAKEASSGVDTLLTRDISRSSAMQRAGRAGREGEGFCFRVYPMHAFDSMVPALEPEICRCDLTAVILELKCLGLDVEGHDFMDDPDEEAVHSGLTTLSILGAIDKHQNLTDAGRKMAELPVDPKFARTILASGELGCSKEVIDVVSAFSVSSRLFLGTPSNDSAAVDAREKFKHPSGDHCTILNAFRAYQEVVSSASSGATKSWCAANSLNERALSEAMEIRRQLRKICGRIGINTDISCGSQVQPILRCLVLGLVQNTAFVQPNGLYKQVMGSSVMKIHPGSVVQMSHPAIVYNELVLTTQMYARGVSVISKAEVSSVFSHISHKF